MGNCVFHGVEEEEEEEVIKVVTSNGGIMELQAPLTAEFVTSEFPGHGIFRSHDLSSRPLLHNEELLVGEVYYLRPINTSSRERAFIFHGIRPTCASASSSSSSASSVVTPYRMSFDTQRILKRSKSDILLRQQEQNNCNINNNYYSRTGGVLSVWKVKLVISPEQLAEILSQETRTEALVKSVRTVAKCGNNGVVASPAKSHKSSISSTSWNKASSSSSCSSSSDRHRHALFDF